MGRTRSSIEYWHAKDLARMNSIDVIQIRIDFPEQPKPFIKRSHFLDAEMAIHNLRQGIAGLDFVLRKAGSFRWWFRFGLRLRFITRYGHHRKGDNPT